VMALVANRKQQIERVIEDLQTNLYQLKNSAPHLSSIEKESISDLEQQIARNEKELREEEGKRAAWALENTLRRTDFTPFAFSMLECMAKEGMLNT